MRATAPGRNLFAVPDLGIDVIEPGLGRDFQCIDDVFTERLSISGENRFQFEIIGGKIQIRRLSATEFVRREVDDRTHSFSSAVSRTFFFIRS